MNVVSDYINIFLKNPLTIWLRWSIKASWLMFKYRKKRLVFKYLADAKNCSFGDYNTFYEYTNLTNSSFGNFVYIANRTIINNTIIGSYCSIGPGCKMGLGIHPIHRISTFPAFFSAAKQCQLSFCDKELFKEYERINIGNDVWIGANAIILDGIKIGDGAVIAAGAVVTKDVEAYAIIGGVPANVIKKRFSDIEIEKIQKTQWWNKDIEWIKKNYKLFNDPALFFNQIDKEN